MLGVARHLIGAMPGAQQSSSPRYGMREAAFSKHYSRCATAPYRHDGRRAAVSFQARHGIELALCLARSSPLLGAMAYARQPCPSAAEGVQQFPSRCIGMCYAAVAGGDATRLVQPPKMDFLL
ncbi:hypothetical protein HAX54_010369 [Datura stramonium]|uniref:Uncharacterized protein n=1 Tax=Datura stramonium TaxID=4076 RepID=A0ABS8WXY4_DATST|nr:hypothetical protein [Datura stramonium]